jgi:hypothetical protein
MQASKKRQAVYFLIAFEASLNSHIGRKNSQCDGIDVDHGDAISAPYDLGRGEEK